MHVALRGLVPYLYLFGPQRAPAPDWVTHVRTWAELDERLALGSTTTPRPPSGHGVG